MNAFNTSHPPNRRFNVTLLRYDGTYVLIQNVKHVLNKRGYIEIYEGEHNVDRKISWWPTDRIDHVVIQEINQ